MKATKIKIAQNRTFFKRFTIILAILSAFICGRNIVCAEVVVAPVSLAFEATMPSSSPQKLVFIGKGLLNPVMYKILPAEGPSGILEPEKFKIKTPYTSDFQPLDRFRTILSGTADEQTEALLSVEIDWNNIPGIYSTRLISNSGEREVPIRITVLPKTIVFLNPAKFDLIPSDMKAPIVTEIQIFTASNSRQWHLYCITEPLIREGGAEQINTSRVYVRQLSPDDSLSWHRLDKPFEVARGGPGPNRKVATIELAFESKREDRPGRYEGTFRFMIYNAP